MDDNINFDFTKLYTEINHYENEMYHDSPLKNTNECKYLTPVEFSKAFHTDNISLSMLYILYRVCKWMIILTLTLQNYTLKLIITKMKCIMTHL